MLQTIEKVALIATATAVSRCAPLTDFMSLLS
jgi:hypothetical protein